jgi:carbon storage regulator
LLVLTRKHNQSIMIGSNIEIMIVEIRGDQVKIGIKAPKNVSIYRSEIYEEIMNENKLATEQAGVDKLGVITKLITPDEKK